MYKKIMVPLDGSELAECVLPHVGAFIQEFKISDVTLIRVEPPEPMYHAEFPMPAHIAAERESAVKSLAKDYLNQVMNRIEDNGTIFHLEVIIGNVVASLIDYTEQNDIDLILIATHGRSGVSRWVRGSIADRILRSSNIPVLMVRAPGTKGGI
jgi:nucleotide-binding universal stress UspA family protein